MASWAIHFRIADYFLDKINTLNKKYFIIGNIAPDCGAPVDGGYDPPSEITHRTGGGNYKGNCDYSSIYEDFIKNETDMNAKSFWIGYFVHYVTDCLWVKEIYDALELEYGPLTIGSDINRKIRNEWYNLDYAYFESNISASFEQFKGFDDFNEAYPCFYKNNEISNRMKYIVSFYENGKSKPMKYRFTTPDIVEKFISKSCDIIFHEIECRNIEL